MEKEDKSLVNFQNWAKGLIYFGIGIFGLFVLIILSQGIGISKEYNAEITGSIGAFIGGIVGAIWALAGVLFFYVALRYQKEELKLQRDELTRTREILKTQADTISKQQFEGTFFSLLELFLKVRQSKVYIEVSDELRDKYDSEDKDFKSNKKTMYLKLKSLYEKRHKKLRSSLESFASITYSIYTFIDDSEIEDKSFYSDLLKSHLFRKDSLFLFVYTLYKEDKKLGQIIIKYDVLKRLFDQQKYYKVIKDELFKSPDDQDLLTLL